MMLLPPTSPLWLVLNLLVVTLLCAACASTSEAPQGKITESRQSSKTVTSAQAPASLDKAQQELASGIASYENGDYKLAARQLQSALALGLESGVDQARAHKYLAFMHCVGGRERLCREEFRKAIDADPSFDLTLAESGHPTWGPVFRKLKAAGKPVAK